MSLYEWLLLLHVLGAFAIGATLVLYGGVLLAERGPEPAAPGIGVLTKLGSVLFNVGGFLTIVFGIWLAIDVDGYELWDFWIAAAIVLWFASAEVGRRLARAFATTRAAGGLYALLFLLVLAFLVMMIFKPGA